MKASKLAKEHLETLMAIAVAKAAAHQANEKLFIEWFERATQIGIALLPYQGPQYVAVAKKKRRGK